MLVGSPGGHRPTVPPCQAPTSIEDPGQSCPRGRSDPERGARPEETTCPPNAPTSERYSGSRTRSPFDGCKVGRQLRTVGLTAILAAHHVVRQQSRPHNHPLSAETSG